MTLYQPINLFSGAPAGGTVPSVYPPPAVPEGSHGRIPPPRAGKRALPAPCANTTILVAGWHPQRTRDRGGHFAGHTKLCILLNVADSKPVEFRGSSLEDLRAFPLTARREAGHQLDLVQNGWEPDDWKPMNTVGQGCQGDSNSG